MMGLKKVTYVLVIFSLLAFGEINAAASSNRPFQQSIPLQQSITAFKNWIKPYLNSLQLTDVQVSAIVRYKSSYEETAKAALDKTIAYETLMKNKQSGSASRNPALKRTQSTPLLRR